MIEKLKDKFTKYEVARILGARALQLAMDAPVLLKIDKEKLEDINFDVLKIAELELEAEVLPIAVKRPLPQKRKEKIKKKKKPEEKKEEKIEEEVKKLEEKERREEEKIREEGEIMELAKPEDERTQEQSQQLKREEGI